MTRCLKNIVFLKCTLQFRRPKNQWLIGRRICSLPDKCNLLQFIDHFLLPSANETNRLLINHWFFGRRIFIAILLSHGKHIPGETSAGQECLKTIGRGSWDWKTLHQPLVLSQTEFVRLDEGLKTIGLVSSSLVRLGGKALKPLVLRSDSPVRRPPIKKTP